MKSRSFIPSKSNDLKGQFKDLNNNEMINLRGGGDPPPDPKPGDDYPLVTLNSTNYTSSQQIPVL